MQQFIIILILLTLLQQFYQKTTMIDSQKLLQKLRTNSSVNPLLQSSRVAQIRLSKQIYNNRSIREIGRFIREADSILRKSKEGQMDKRVKTEYQQQKGRYDENQLKQLDYQFQSIKEKYLADASAIEYDISQFQLNQTRKRDSIRNRLAQLNKGTLKRRPTLLEHHSALPIQARRQSIQNQNIVKKQISFNEPLSPLRLKRRLTNIDNYHQQLKISLKQQQLQAALKNLVDLIGTKQSYNYKIESEQIYKLISQKYKFHRTNQTNKQQFIQGILKLTNSNPNTKKPNGEKNKQKFALQIPYCQFVSLKGCRKSIDRIFNMPLKAAQRIAFKIYDRNGNGIIDQKDIIQLFTLAEQIEPMQMDMQVIIKNYKLSSEISNKNNSPRNRARLNTKVFLDGQSQFSLSKLNKIEVIEQDVKNTIQSKKFRKSAFFTFKQTKQQFFKCKPYGLQTSISLTWEDFQSAFKNTRPQIYYNLLDYLFNINSQQIYAKAQKSSNEQQRNSFRISIFNSDGKSEVGSINNHHNSQKELTEKDKRSKQEQSQNSYSYSNNKSFRQNRGTSKQKQKNFSQVKESGIYNIANLISKVKSIQQFQSVAY